MAFDPWVYDQNKDCYISEAEKAQAEADYQNGVITMSNLMAVVNLWLNSTRNPACGTPPVFDPWAYDTDGDCYISTAEKDQAIADWQSGVITMSNAMAVVNLWNQHTRNPACGGPLPEEFPWKWLAIAGAAIAGVILLIPGPKKAKEK